MKLKCSLERAGPCTCLQAIEEVIIEDEALPPDTQHTQNVAPQGLLRDPAVQAQVQLLHDSSQLRLTEHESWQAVIEVCRLAPTLC